ncbi:MAG: hypothetical protein ACRDDY_15780 [Clostridium sp.]|uniref:hypothetical protein n=1 Tax=Clostridium sp. TaxID=1506 RepID=UPI003EE5DE9C
MSDFINFIKGIYKENFKALSFASIIILIPLILLIITKLNPKNSDFRQLNSISTEVYKMNSSLSSCIENDTVNTDKSKEILPLLSKDLDIAKQNVLVIQPSTNNEKVKSALDTSLTLNINLVKQALSMYLSPDSDNLEKNLKEYKETFSLYIESLKNLDIYGLNKITSDESISFFKNTCTYFDTVINLNTLTDIKKTSERNFLLKLSPLLTKFDSLNEDLAPAITNIKENNKSLTPILEDLDKKKNIFSEIEEEYYMLSIPESGSLISNALEVCIQEYKLYLNTLNDAINLNLVEADNNLAQNLYDEAFKSYNNFNTSYTNLKNEISNLKNK